MREDWAVSAAGSATAWVFCWIMWRATVRGRSWPLVLSLAIGLPLLLAALIGVGVLGVWKFLEIT